MYLKSYIALLVIFCASISLLRAVEAVPDGDGPATVTVEPSRWPHRLIHTALIQPITKIRFLLRAVSMLNRFALLALAGFLYTLDRLVRFKEFHSSFVALLLLCLANAISKIMTTIRLTSLLPTSGIYGDELNFKNAKALFYWCIISASVSLALMAPEFYYLVARIQGPGLEMSQNHSAIKNYKIAMLALMSLDSFLEISFAADLSTEAYPNIRTQNGNSLSDEGA